MTLQEFVNDICAKLRDDKEFTVDTSNMDGRKLIAGIIANAIFGPQVVTTVEQLLKELMEVSGKHDKLLSSLATREEVKVVKSKGKKNAVKEG